MNRIALALLGLLCIVVSTGWAAEPQSAAQPAASAEEERAIIGAVDGADRITQTHITGLLKSHGIECAMEGSIAYGLSVSQAQARAALELLRNDLKTRHYSITLEDGFKSQPYGVSEQEWKTTKPNQRYETLLTQPEFAANTDLGAVLRAPDIRQQSATFPYVTLLRTFRREYVDAQGAVKVGHEVELELAVSVTEDIATLRGYYQVWEAGKKVELCRESEWWTGHPGDVARNRQRYDHRPAAAAHDAATGANAAKPLEDEEQPAAWTYQEVSDEEADAVLVIALSVPGAFENDEHRLALRRRRTVGARTGEIIMGSWHADGIAKDGRGIGCSGSIEIVGGEATHVTLRVEASGSGENVEHFEFQEELQVPWLGKASKKLKQGEAITAHFEKLEK